MHVYKTLRAITRAIRATVMAVDKLSNKADDVAERIGAAAIAAGHAALNRLEDKAFNRLMRIKDDVEARIEQALDHEAAAHEDFQSEVEALADHRRMLEIEVL